MFLLTETLVFVMLAARTFSTVVESRKLRLSRGIAYYLLQDGEILSFSVNKLLAETFPTRFSGTINYAYDIIAVHGSAFIEPQFRLILALGGMCVIVPKVCSCLLSTLL